MEALSIACACTLAGAVLMFVGGYRAGKLAHRRETRALQERIGA